MTFLEPKLAEVVGRDARYAYEAYEFMFRALHHTQKSLGRELKPDIEPGDARLHVRGRELLEGVRLLGLAEFGLLARTVFAMWGIHRTVDFGNIVFNLIEAGLMSGSDDDSIDDFRDVYDFEQALDYRIQLNEAQ